MIALARTRVVAKMVPNRYMLIHRPLRLLLGRQRLQDICTRQWQLNPPETTTVQPAIYNPDDIAKITGVPPEAVLTLDHLQGGPARHDGTTAYELRDVSFVNGWAYKGAFKHQFRANSEPYLIPGKVDHSATGLVTVTGYGSKYFGHWMTEDVTRSLAAVDLGEPAVMLPLDSPFDLQRRHRPDYLALLGIDPLTTVHAQFDRLVVLDDNAQNAYKRQRYQIMRDRLARLQPYHSGHGVMLLRREHGVRRLMVNEVEIAAHLERQGFLVIDPIEMSVEEIVRHTLDAKVVVGVEGSQLIHGLFTLRQNGVIVALEPPDRFSWFYKAPADALGLRFAFIVGDATEGGFTIDSSELDSLLESLKL
jgi:hypothetical protein